MNISKRFLPNLKHLSHLLTKGMFTMSLDKVIAFSLRVREEIHNDKRLTGPQKELYYNEIEEAMEYAKETKTWDTASALVAMTALRRVRDSVRNADNVSVSIETAIEKLMTELPTILQKALDLHTKNCPMSTFDPEKFYGKLMGDVDKKLTGIIKIEPKQARTLKELFWKFANKAVDKYTPYIICVMGLLVWKYGWGAIVAPLMKLFGFGGVEL